jgi:hypothetical protein
MNKATISLVVGVSLVLFGAQLVHARGFGGSRGGGGASRGGYSGGASRGGHSSGESHGYSGGESRGYSGSESRGGYSSGGQSGRRESGNDGAAAGAGAEKHNAPQDSGAQGAAAGAAAEKHNAPQYSGAQGAAAGAAAEKHNAPQYSGAQGAAAGAAAEKHNAPQYSGAQGAAAGAAAANRNAPQYSGAQGAAAGYAAGNRNTSPVGAGQVGLPTDAGYGVPAAGTGAAAYAGYHQTQAVSGSVYAARGAAVRTSYNGAGMFGQGWYAAHPGAWNPAGWAAGRAWGVAAWPAVGAWYGWGSSVQPAYYDYGNNITYQGDQVYYGDQPAATADQYYQQASTLAQSQSAPDPNTGEWLPLGVFGLVKGTESDPHYVMQLAVNKAGAVAGNYYDVVSGTSVPVHGAVDKQTQRLAWTVGDNKNTVGETGIYNLTKDESPALIHLGQDRTQQWTLVRLQQPPAKDGQQ